MAAEVSEEVGPIIDEVVEGTIMNDHEVLIAIVEGQCVRQSHVDRETKGDAPMEEAPARTRSSQSRTRSRSSSSLQTREVN